MTDLKWAPLLHQTGDGFIVVDEPEKYADLGPGIATAAGQQQYDVSVFHQLHCLTYVRTYLYAVLDVAQRRGGGGGGDNDDGDRAFLAHEDDHVFHCLDYVRQGLMCSADLTVERPREEPDGSRFAVDGWGVGHECKSWVSLVNGARVYVCIRGTVLRC